MIPGDIFDGHYVLRSINWETRRATYENLDTDVLDFRNRFETGSFYSLPVDRGFLRTHLFDLIAFASERMTGKCKVSKACVKRLTGQLRAMEN